MSLLGLADDVRYSVKQIRILREKAKKKEDLRADRIINGSLTGRSAVKSNLIDIDAITEQNSGLMRYASYKTFLEFMEKRVEDSNKLTQKEGHSEIKVNLVDHFDLPGERLPKYTLLLGNTKNPEFRMLVLAVVHGGENTHALANLEGALQLALPGDERHKLLEKGMILFDPVVDPFGYNNQTRGAVTRDARGVNAPIVGQSWVQPGLRNPWGFGDRNSAQGRNSLETQDPLTRANQAHYRQILGGKASWVFDMHETCEGTHWPDLAFTYGGIMLMVHIYITDDKLEYLNKLESRITWWRKLKAFLNEHNPLEGPMYREQLLYHDPRMQKIIWVRERIKELGQRTFEEKFDRAFLFLPHVERDIRIDESVYVGGMMFRVPGILLGPDVLGFEGITTESFQQDRIVRAKQTIASLEAQLQVVGLGYKGRREASPPRPMGGSR